jgi:hypothetical protein
MPLPKEVVEEILESITTAEREDDDTTSDFVDFSTRKPHDPWGRFSKVSQRTPPKKTTKEDSDATRLKRSEWEDLNVILDQYIQDMDLDEDDLGGSP